MIDDELHNITLLSSDIAEFIASKSQTNTEKTYSLLYAALALNLSDNDSMKFLEEAFLEVLSIANYKSSLV